VQVGDGGSFYGSHPARIIDPGLTGAKGLIDMGGDYLKRNLGLCEELETPGRSTGKDQRLGYR
jgi:hypothetical protein